MLPSIERGDSKMTAATTTNTSMAKIAIVAALALSGVVVVMVAVTISLQQAEALAGSPGCGNGTRAFFASRGNCFHMLP
jgi:hypothetical protein